MDIKRRNIMQACYHRNYPTILQSLIMHVTEQLSLLISETVRFIQTIYQICIRSNDR